MKVGFTGTSEGLTKDQARQLQYVLEGVTEFHHGDCVGADGQAHFMVSCRRVGHPPTKSHKRAFCKFDEERGPKPYLERNRDIVDETDRLVGCPKLMREELRSGTWATIRYARKRGKPVTIVWPDGTITT